jgi:hypothetical protein
MRKLFLSLLYPQVAGKEPEEDFTVAIGKLYLAVFSLQLASPAIETIEMDEGVELRNDEAMTAAAAASTPPNAP